MNIVTLLSHQNEIEDYRYQYMQGIKEKNRTLRPPESVHNWQFGSDHKYCWDLAKINFSIKTPSQYLLRPEPPHCHNSAQVVHYRPNDVDICLNWHIFQITNPSFLSQIMKLSSQLAV